MPAPFSGDEEKGDGKRWKGEAVKRYKIQYKMYRISLVMVVHTPCLPLELTVSFYLSIVEKTTLSKVIFTGQIVKNPPLLGL